MTPSTDRTDRTDRTGRTDRTDRTDHPRTDAARTNADDLEVGS